MNELRHRYHYLWSILTSRRELRRRVCWFWQRRTRGFDDTVLWSLDYHLTRYILPRLKAFAEKKRAGYPSSITPEKWQEILDEMVFAFEYTKLDSEHCQPYDPEVSKRVDRGFKLFAKWYGALWD